GVRAEDEEQVAPLGRPAVPGGGARPLGLPRPAPVSHTSVLADDHPAVGPEDVLPRRGFVVVVPRPPDASGRRGPRRPRPWRRGGRPVQPPGGPPQDGPVVRADDGDSSKAGAIAEGPVRPAAGVAGGRRGGRQAVAALPLLLDQRPQLRPARA